jgi:GlpG protein
MRQIGTLDNEPDAERLAAYLVTQGIEAHAETDGDGWAIWVRDENDLESARESFQQFRVDPRDPRYRGAERAANSILREKEKERRRAADNVIEMRDRWRQGSLRKAPLTSLLIVASVLVTLATNFGHNRLMRRLGFCDPVHRAEAAWSEGRLADKFVDIRQGQVWRLVTPIFAHGGSATTVFGVLHLAFNMYWLFVLGAPVENRKGSLFFGLLVLVVAVLSNTAQAAFESPWFLGMSGVVYGLFGYVWMKTLFDPAAGIAISRGTITFFIVWFFLCFLGLMGPIANTAHGAGLAVGIAIGYAPVLWKS